MSELRNAINHIDAGILDLLKRRKELSLSVAKLKQEHTLPVLDKEREEELLSTLSHLIEIKDLKEEEEYLVQIWGKILEMSRDMQTKLHQDESSIER